MKLRLWELIYAYARAAGHDRERAIQLANHSLRAVPVECQTEPDDKAIAMKVAEFAVDFQFALLDVLEPEDLKEWRN